MTTHLWLSIVTNGGPLKINGATGHTAWQVIASIESRWYGKTHASFALHWVTASVVTTRACRKMSAAMVTSGKFLWGSRSAVSLAPGSAVGKKGKKRGETAKDKNNNLKKKKTVREASRAVDWGGERATARFASRILALCGFFSNPLSKRWIFLIIMLNDGQPTRIPS